MVRLLTGKGCWSSAKHGRGGRTTSLKWLFQHWTANDFSESRGSLCFFKERLSLSCWIWLICCCCWDTIRNAIHTLKSVRHRVPSLAWCKWCIGNVIYRSVIRKRLIWRERCCWMVCIGKNHKAVRKSSWKNQCFCLQHVRFICCLSSANLPGRRVRLLDRKLSACARFLSATQQWDLSKCTKYTFHPQICIKHLIFIFIFMQFSISLWQVEIWSPMNNCVNSKTVSEPKIYSNHQIF